MWPASGQYGAPSAKISVESTKIRPKTMKKIGQNSAKIVMIQTKTSVKFIGIGLHLRWFLQVLQYLLALTGLVAPGGGLGSGQMAPSGPVRVPLGHQETFSLSVSTAELESMHTSTLAMKSARQFALAVLL